MTAPSSTLKWLAIAAILGTGLIHVVEARDAFGEATYKGLLFVANGVGALVRVAGGYAADRTRQAKWVAVLGYGVSALSRIAMLPAHGFTAITGVVTVDRLGKGLRTAPRDAMIADASEPSMLGRSFGVFGKVGTTYGRTETSALAGSGIAAGTDHGFGLSYGAGVSYEFTPRLSATLEWDSNDFRFAGSGRDPVRSTSLGLQYRY